MNDATSRRHVFVTGGTGFMGSRVIAELLRRGYTVRALMGAVESPCQGICVLGAPEIRQA